MRKEKQIKYTHIYIKPIVRKRKYVAEFSCGTETFMAETTIGGDSHAHCLEKVEKFLGFKLDKTEYTFIS